MSTRILNPFISIKLTYVIVIYSTFVCFKLFLPTIDILLYGCYAPFAFERVFSEALLYLILILPLLFFQKDKIGWVHPLIFFPLWYLIQKIVGEPNIFFYPTTVFEYSSINKILYHDALENYDQNYIAETKVKANLLECLAFLCYYSGYIILKIDWLPKIKYGKPRFLEAKALILVLISLVTFIFFLKTQGGLQNYLIMWGMEGRVSVQEGHGQIFSVIQIAISATLTWFTLKRKPQKNPIFILALLYSVPIMFLTSGSRASLLFVLVIFGLISIIKSKELPSLAFISTFIFMGIFLFGSLGAMRKGLNKGEVDTQYFYKLNKSLEEASEQVSQRGTKEDGVMAVLGNVPHNVEHLYFEPYIAAILFWFPRKFWKEKPYGTGRLSGNLLYGYREVGVPVGPVGQAYWCFNIPGVVFIFVLFGSFHRWIKNLFLKNESFPPMWLVYVLALFYITPMTRSLVMFFWIITPTVFLLYWTNSIKKIKF